MSRTLAGGNDKQDESRATYVPEWPASVAPTLNAHFGDKQGLEDQHALNGAGLFVPDVSLARGASGDHQDPTYETFIAVASPLTAGSHPNSRASGRRQEDDVNIVAETLRSHPRPGSNSVGSLALSENQRAEVRLTEVTYSLAGTGGKPGQGYPATFDGDMSVRRLTPTECERLQGFPDGWTAGLSDSARYRTLGNAVCVPVAAWIARRIVLVDGRGEP